MKPAEGTILTVSRLAAARAADAARQTPNDPEAVLEAAIQELSLIHIWIRTKRRIRGLDFPRRGRTELKGDQPSGG